jgi:hypothetical protein
MLFSPKTAAPSALFPTTSTAKVQAALEHIPADLPYEDWVRVLSALHSENLRDLAHSWSSGDLRYKYEEVEEKWASFNSEKDTRVGIGTLFHISKQYRDTLSWPEPIPLPSGLSRVAAYDENLLPEVLRDFVSDIAERMQCPPDFPAISVLVSIAALIGRRCGINPKQKDDWLVVPNLWGALLAGRL